MVSASRKAQKAYHDADAGGAADATGTLVVPHLPLALNGQWRSQEDVDRLLVQAP